VRRTGFPVFGTALARAHTLLGVAVVAGLRAVQNAVAAGHRRVDTSSPWRRAAVVGLDAGAVGRAAIAAGRATAAASRAIGGLRAALTGIGTAGASAAVVAGHATRLHAVTAARNGRTGAARNGAVVAAF